MPSLAQLPTRFLGARLTPALTLTESGFLFCARDGETFSLNPSGACLLRALAAGVPAIEVWRELVKRFEVSAPVAQRDAQLFLSRLFSLGVLELPRDPEGPSSDAAEAADSPTGSSAGGEARR
jgi:hypothetical protein